ncbi:MEDS domain-containing protein [Dactylosporangium sp. NPDC051541]|uniref:MEDS domain-containing protein n=1 Tax=Dactylosporangium sp. NPDC051541 TaxID=3363977 RepID=UPI0037A5535C
MEISSTAPTTPTATHDHRCVVFDDLAGFRAHAGGFLAEGITDGQQVIYVGADHPDRLAADMAGVPGFRAALRTGQASVAALDSLYTLGQAFDPEQQVSVFASTADAALRRGFTGLRVAADITALAADPALAGGYARYEHLVDRFMSRRPVTGMCGLRRGTPDAATVTALACLHPTVRSVQVPFQLHSSADAQVSAVLTGEIDTTSHRLFAASLRHVDLPQVDGHVVLDARGLSFIDHRGLLHLADRLRAQGATGTLLTAAHGEVLRILIDLLDLGDLRVVTP